MDCTLRTLSRWEKFVERPSLSQKYVELVPNPYGNWFGLLEGYINT